MLGESRHTAPTTKACLGHRTGRCIEYAQRKNRTLLTNDPGFFSLLEEGPHHGILYLTTQRAPIGRIIRDIARLVDTSRPEEFENNIFYIPRNP